MLQNTNKNLIPQISAERKKELNLFEKQINIRFKSCQLLNLAFCHRSYSNELGKYFDNNERLEFLGDSVLGIVVSEYLYCNLSDKKEGELAKIKSFVVSELVLAQIARNIRLDNFLLIGKGEEYSGGRNKKAILADTMEAIIGAYYLDSGFKKAKQLVLKIIIPEINTVLQNKHQKDYKTLLQELVQKKYKTYPKYKTIKKSGPDHNRTFWIEVYINNENHGQGKGKNKKEAEQNAAEIAYKQLAKTESPDDNK